MSLRRSVAFAIRSVLLFGFWLLLLEPGDFSLAAIGVDLAVGAVAAAAGALLSLRLLPPARTMPRPGPLLRLALRFLLQSLLAGFDVARRALDPRLPVRPGLIRHPTTLPPGPGRALFGALTSQIPGTLAAGSEPSGELLYHCLDLNQDVARGLSSDETLFLKASGVRGDEGRRRP